MYPLDQTQLGEDYEELLLYYAKIYNELLIQTKQVNASEKFMKFYNKLAKFLYFSNHPNFDKAVKLIDSQFDVEIQEQIKGKTFDEKLELFHKKLGKIDAKNFPMADNTRDCYKLQTEQMNIIEREMDNYFYVKLVGKLKDSYNTLKSEQMTNICLSKYNETAEKPITVEEFKNQIQVAIEKNELALKIERAKYIEHLIQYQSKFYGNSDRIKNIVYNVNNQ